jgi:hypothetical protein
MTKNASLPVSVLIDLYVRLRDEIETRKRSASGLDPNDTKRAALAMAVLHASVLIPNDILGIEEQVRGLLQPTLKVGI